MTQDFFIGVTLALSSTMQKRGAELENSVARRETTEECEYARYLSEIEDVGGAFGPRRYRGVALVLRP